MSQAGNSWLGAMAEFLHSAVEPLAMMFLDQNKVSAEIYHLVALVFTAIFLGYCIAWVRLPARRRWRSPSGRMMLSLWMMALGEATLTEWFSVSRDLGRPEEMFQSWVPVSCRAVMLMGAAIGLSTYRGYQVLALLVVAAILIRGYDGLLTYIYG